jgi:hypothetical protein
MPDTARTKERCAALVACIGIVARMPSSTAASAQRRRLFERISVHDGITKRFNPWRNRIEHRFLAALHPTTFHNAFERHFERRSNIPSVNNRSSSQQRASAPKCRSVQRTGCTADGCQESLPGHIKDSANIALLKCIEFDDHRRETAIQIGAVICIANHRIEFRQFGCVVTDQRGSALNEADDMVNGDLHPGSLQINISSQVRVAWIAISRWYQGFMLNYIPQRSAGVLMSMFSRAPSWRINM